MTVPLHPLWSVAFLCWLLLPLTAVFDRRDTNRLVWPCLVGLGAFALLVASIVTPLPRTVTLGFPFSLGTAVPAFHVDALARWFLATIAIVSLCLTPYLRAYMTHAAPLVDMRMFWIGLGCLLASMVGVVLAANVQTFLVSWEVMSISSFLLVISDHRTRATRIAGLVYLGATRIGSACLAGGFIWAYVISGSWQFVDWHISGLPALGPGLLILIGLGVKAGVWPFHLWLPLAHPSAPSPVSALMSGTMVKVAVYGFVRFFIIPAVADGQTVGTGIAPAFAHPAFGHVLLAIGAVSAFWGVLFALLQHDLKRLLAYHTVENVGLITMGVGLCIVARATGLQAIAALALAAALFHVTNHAVFKSLLFLSAGAVDVSAGTRDLERLGGLAGAMPRTFVAFLLGSAAICALPPLNGFASEWLLYQSFVGAGCSGPTPLFRFLGLIAVGWIALVGALALTCFLKACGVAFLGRPRSSASLRAREVGTGMWIAQCALGFLCIALGVGAPLVLRVLQNVVAPVGGGAALSAAWTLPMGAVLLTLAVGIVLGRALLQHHRCAPRRYSTWDCGFGPLSPRMQTTATSFVQPVARLFGALYRYVVNVAFEGRDRRHFPEDISAEPAIRSLLATRVYLPFVHAVNALAKRLVKLQAGSIHLYLFTMFVTLWLLIFLGKYIP